MPEPLRKAGAFVGALCFVVGLIAVVMFLLELEKLVLRHAGWPIGTHRHHRHGLRRIERRDLDAH